MMKSTPSRVTQGDDYLQSVHLAEFFCPQLSLVATILIKALPNSFDSLSEDTSSSDKLTDNPFSLCSVLDPKP